MAVPTDPDLLVLHTLRLKSFVDADVVANAARLSEPVVAGALAALHAAGLVARRDGRFVSWSLTPTGRAEGERRLAAELDRAGCRDAVADAYRRFRALNSGFLELCTRWQLRRDGDAHVLNDHDDPAYDAAVVAELDDVDRAVQPICSDLAGALERFGWYNGRFAAARLRVHAGEHEWFTMPAIDSYHSIWFELHENLLATLNLQRAAESA